MKQKYKASSSPQIPVLIQQNPEILIKNKMQSFQKKKVNKKSGQTLYHNGPAVPAGGEEEGFFPAAVMKCDRLSGAASIQAGTQKHTYCSKS